MEVILLKNLDNLGRKHSVVEVKNGYGRNYLIPQGLAVIANKTNTAKLQTIIDKAREEEDKEIAELNDLLAKIQEKDLKIAVKAGTSGKIFGSVTNIQIANAIKEQLDLDVDKKSIQLGEEDIKELGDYKVKVKFHPKVKGEIGISLFKD